MLVLGDVNPGAEVVAGGSVVVWGRLRGVVEAGQAEGSGPAVVCALDLAPTQLRLGTALARLLADGAVEVAEVRALVEFIRTSKRGVVMKRRGRAAELDAEG